MKKIAIQILLLLAGAVSILTGCATKKVNSSSIEENYTGSSYNKAVKKSSDDALHKRVLKRKVSQVYISSPRSFGVELEDALLLGYWVKVIKLLEQDKSIANDLVARLLMGHASLATNRNNASMLLFLSGTGQSNLLEWVSWTESFVRIHPNNPVALYLTADARARTGKLEEAINGFSEALRLTQNAFALAQNARGVAYIANDQWDNAQVDFYMASMQAPEFADAYANLGTLSVLREVSIQGSEAIGYFDKALKINPGFALAYNGRGCLYFGNGEFDQAVQDFRSALQLNPKLEIAAINQSLVELFTSQIRTGAKQNESVPDEIVAVFPYMPPEQQQSVVKEYGKDAIMSALQKKIDRNTSQFIQLNQESQNLHGKDYTKNKLKLWNHITQLFVGSGFINNKSSKNLEHKWEYYLNSGDVLKK